MSAAYADLLLRRAGVVELRAFRGGQAKPLVGRFDSVEALMREAGRLSGNCAGVYTTLNRIRPESLGDSGYSVTNSVGVGVNGVTDADISQRLWLPLDFDSSVRPKDSPASDSELEDCIEVAKGVGSWLAGKGWPEPVAGCSGNGYHLLFAVNAPSTEDTRLVVRRLFVRIALEVLTNWKSRNVKFDTVCFNASRIWKLYGTVAQKGHASPDRPFRTSHCRLPSELNEVPWELVLDLAGSPDAESVWLRQAKQIIDPGRKVDYTESNEQDFSVVGKGDFQTMDVVRWFEAHNAYRFAMREEGKHSVFCPWAANHSSVQDARGTDTVVWEPGSDGGDDERRWPVFHCSHESCGDTPSNPSGKKRDFLDLLRFWGDADKYCAASFSTSEAELGDKIAERVTEQVGVSAEVKSTALPARPAAQGTEQRPDAGDSSAQSPVSTADGTPAATANESVPADAVVELEDAAKTSFSKVSRNPFSGGFVQEMAPGDSEPMDVDAEVAKLSEGASASTADGPGGDSEDEDDKGSVDGVRFGTAKEFTLEYLIENLVTIHGTTGTYHIGRDWLMSSAQVANAYRGMANKWSKSKHRQVVDKENFVFDPSLPPLQHTDRPTVLNRFRGMPPIREVGSQEQVELIRKHIVYLCEDNEEYGNWVIGWLAHGLQHPGVKLRSALIFKGVEGTGKNLFFDIFTRTAYGKYAAVIDAETLCGRYNSWARDKLFVLGNEIATAKDRRDIPNKLKHYVTGDSFNLEGKFQDVIVDEPNRMNFVFLSNEEVPITMSDSDRRYAVFDIGYRRNDHYYWELWEALYGGGIHAFCTYLLNVDYKAIGFDPRRDPPWTDTKRSAVVDRMAAHDLFLQSVKAACLRDGAGPDSVPGVDMPYEPLYHRGVINRQDLWLAFKYWCGEYGKGTQSISNQRFYNAARKLFGKETVKLVAVDSNGAVLPPGPTQPDAKRRTMHFFEIGQASKGGASMALPEFLASATLFRRCLDANMYRDTAPPVHAYAVNLDGPELTKG